MKTRNQNKSLDVEVGKVKLKSRGTDLVFLHPAYGPGKYVEVGNEIEQDNLSLSSAGKASYLVNASLNSEDDKDVKVIMKNNMLITYTDLHYFPRDIIFYHDPQTLADRIKNPTQKQLEEMLGSRQEDKVVFSDDESLRLVQGKFPRGELQKGSLGSHPNIIGLTGSREAANELDEAASTHNKNPKLWLLDGFADDFKIPGTRVSVLSSMDFSYWLDINGDVQDCYTFGCSFGVQN